jgi:YrbI family 3-deoxy-D-manno-octulosonate 8-phosphate phosphatase
MGEIVALIPARAGSKSIPNKNCKTFFGKPLIHWSVLAAIKCRYIDKVFVSTDGRLIKDSLRSIKSKKLKIINRSPETATDEASTESAMLEFSKSTKFKIIILIQPTSPQISCEDLTNAIKYYKRSDAISLVSVVRQKRFIWESKNDYIYPLNYEPALRPRRQDFNGFLVENGAFYITSKSALENTKCRISGKTIKYEMSDKTYYEIDEEIDWVVNEAIMKNKFTKLDKKKFSLKLFATDVDGVLTDSGMYYSENGDESKKFNTRDGKGIEILKENKIKTAIITSEDTKLVYQRGKKLKFDYIEQGINNKLEKVKEICKKEGIGLHQVAFIGDDVNDTELLKEVGFSGVPSDAHAINIQIAEYVCKSKGGHGCVREFIELITNQLSN